MHPATLLHSVGVITKLYFAIFAAFQESTTSNLAQRSFKVIDFGTNRKRVIHRLIATCTVSEIRHHTAAIFPTPLLFRLEFGVFPLE